MNRKRIPTIIGLLILIIGIAVSVFLINEGTRWFSRAAPETTPKQVKFTNITNNSFSVSWVTDEATSGFVRYGTTTKLDQVARDDRDELTGQIDNFIVHHVTLENLNSATPYQLQIGSSGATYDNNGQNYQITTAPALTTPLPSSDVANGKVEDQAGLPAEGAIVYLSLPGAIPQSTLVKASGDWVIPLNLARSEDLSTYAQYDKQATIEEILVQAGGLGTATAVVSTKNDNPVPTITLGENHDFRTAALPSEEETEEEITSSGFTLEELESPSLATPSPTEVTIINPSDKEEVNTQKPEIQGKGPPGKVLEITVESPQTYTDTIVVDANGSWDWRPPANLEPGEHTITITYEDEEGQEQTLSQTFVVLAAGESELPSLTATPSGTATPSPTPSPSPSPIVSPSPSATPEGRVSMPSTEEGVPESGYLTPTFLVFIMGLVLITFGLFSNSLLKKKFY